MMKFIAIFNIAFLASQLAFARSADQVNVMPHTGNLPTWGQLDLTKTAAVKGEAAGACYATSTTSALSFANLPALYGGTGINSSSSTGIAHDTAGTWSISAVNLANTDVTGNLPVTHLNSGTNANSLTAFFGDGTWKTPSITQLAPVSGNLGSGTTTIYTPYYLVTSPFTATAGATYALGASSCSVHSTVTAATLVVFDCANGVTATPGVPVNQNSGTGDSTVTYFSYTAPIRVAITVIGGGGGGGTASNTTPGGTGGTSYFGSISGSQNTSCTGGTGGAYQVASGGGSCVGGLGTGNVPNGLGTYGNPGLNGNASLGGAGGGSGCAGGGGRAATSTTANLPGSAGAANTGGGGAGGNSDGTNFGSFGGGGGGCLIGDIYKPTGGYNVSVGAGGTAAGAHGSAGGSGFVSWEFFYY